MKIQIKQYRCRFCLCKPKIICLLRPYPSIDLASIKVINNRTRVGIVFNHVKHVNLMHNGYTQLLYGL